MVTGKHGGVTALFVAAVAIGLAGCSSTTTPPATTTSAAPATSPPATSKPPGTAVNNFLITTDGIAMVTLGMSRADFTAATGAKVEDTQGCGDKPTIVTGAPDGMTVSFTSNNIIKSVTTTNVQYATTNGAAVGMATKELKQVYPTGLASYPYPDDTDPPSYGQFGVSNADKSRSIIFSMDHGKVASITVINGAAGFLDQC